MSIIKKSFNRIKGQDTRKTLLKVPINLLMFCKELKITNEEFMKGVNELTDEKIAGAFELENTRIESEEQLKKIIEMEGAVKLYKIPNSPATTIYGGTVYEYQGQQTIAFIAIDIKDPNQSYLSVYSRVQNFRDVIARNFLDLLVRIK